MSIDRKLGPADRQILDDASANHKLLIAIDAPRVELAKQKKKNKAKRIKGKSEGFPVRNGKMLSC